MNAPGRLSIPIAIAAAVLISGILSATNAQALEPEKEFALLSDILGEYSIVTLTGASKDLRDVLSTRLEPRPNPGEASLIYQRATYSNSDDSSLQRRQVIQYTLTLSDLDLKSVEVQPEQDDGAGGKFWPVSVSIQSGTNPIPYSNLVEMRRDDGPADVTSSRSRVRQVILGYFSDQDQAKMFAEKFRAWMNHPETGAKPAKPGVKPATKPSTQSSA